MTTPAAAPATPAPTPSTPAPAAATPPTPAARPDYIPEKFWDGEKGQARVEELAKSYAELEQKFSKPPQGQTKPNEATPDEKAAQALADKGLNIVDFQKEFDEKGALSEESYTKLSEKGIPKEMVDNYIAGQQALTEQFINTAYAIAGGEEKYTAMKAWAGANLKPEELTAFNDAVTTGTPEAAKLAIQGLAAKYAAASGTDPNLQHSGGPAASSNVFRSWQEVTVAMSDSRYSNDPAYQKEVADKLARSALK
jgi:hypothetical protein